MQFDKECNTIVERLLGSPSTMGDDTHCSHCGEPIGAQHSPYCHWKGTVAGEDEDLNYDNIKRDWSPFEVKLNTGLDKAADFVGKIFR